jgi:crotonobetainyl-CoA:carnitine CoA-transferase CaiB-like acyl-CoA transferase
MAAGGRLSRPLRVIDLSSLWAGPLAGSMLAAAGADVAKIESRARPDPLRVVAPEFFARLNGAKREAVVELGDAAGRQGLADMIAGADMVITSARPRAFAQLGLQPERLFALNPSLTWVAISGYGWSGPDSDRVAFGDDAAAAGGLVRWTASGAPRFAGDALADPLTGLAAAAGAFKAIRRGGGFLVDAALARTAAGAAMAFA